MLWRKNGNVGVMGRIVIMTINVVVETVIAMGCV
jgi:hypothetical protein